jgi:hypothetical protein
MKRLTRILLLAAVVPLLAGLGCYTMLQHQGSPDLTSGDTYGDDSAGKDCVDCHSNTDAYHWTDPYYDWYTTSPVGWTTYAYDAHPWWNGEWYWNQKPANDSGVERNGQHAWTRSDASPLPSTPGTTVAPPSGSIPSSSTGSRDSTRTPPAPERPRPADDKRPHGWTR